MLGVNQCFNTTHCFQLHYKDNYMNIYCYENLKHHMNIPFKKTPYRIKMNYITVYGRTRSK